MTALLVALLLGAPAWAASMVEVTAGVVGRDLAVRPAEGVARALVDQQAWREAAHAWREVSAMAQSSQQSRVDALLWAAICFHRGGAESSAGAAMLDAILLAPGHPRVMMTAAWMLADAGGGRGAARLIRDVPLGHADAAGVVLLELRAPDIKPRRARRILDRAAAAGQADAWVWFEAGLMQTFAGDPRGLLLLERARRSSHASPTHDHVLVHVRTVLGDTDGAAEVAVGGLASHGDHPVIVDAITWLIDQEDGARALDQAASGEVDPTLAELLGAWFLDRGEARLALPHLARVAESGQATPSELSRWARAVDFVEGPQAATVALVEAVDRHPGDLGLRASLADAAIRGRDEAMLLDAARLLQATAQAPLQLVLAAHEAALSLSDGTEALRWANCAAASGADPAQVAFMRGAALRELGLGAEALEAFESGLRYAPRDPALLGAMADLLLRQGTGLDPQPQRARELAEQALAESPRQEARMLSVLAEACWRTGDRARALRLQRQAVDLDPSNGELTGRLIRYEDAWR